MPMPMECCILKINQMKKSFYIVVLLVNFFANAQENYATSIEFSLPRIKGSENFFFSEWELNPAEMLNKFSDVEALQNTNSKGQFLSVKGESVQYDINNGINGSKIVTTYANNQKFSQASYKNGLLDGTKTIYHSSGMPFQEFEFKKGKVDGVCKVYDSDNNLVFETNYKNNLKNGIRKFYTGKREGEILEGNFVNGNLVGDLKFYTQNNFRYTLPNDLRNGKVICFYNDQKLSEFSILDGKVNGIAHQFNIKSGTIVAKIPYCLGEKNGFAEFYSPQGELVNKTEYKFGKKVGNHKIISTDNKLIKEEYYDDHGIKTGIWKDYDKQGQLIREQEYKNDSLNGFSKRYDKGFLQEITAYKNGKKEGLAKFYKSGTTILESEVYYENDDFYKEIIYYDSGTTFSVKEINRKNNAISAKYFNPNGSLFHENKFLNNIAVGLNKSIDKKDNTLIVRTETLYDEKNNRIKQTSFGYKNDGSYTQYNFRNNTWHGESKSFNAATNETRINYYYETNSTFKNVTKEEFEKLTAAEKK